MFGCCSSSTRPGEHVGPTSVPVPLGPSHALLPPQVGVNRGRKCLLLDLDETLVHSSFDEKHRDRADFTITVEIEGTYMDVFVLKRPGVDQFLARAAELLEVVVWTASLAKYGNPVMDALDPDGHVFWRLFRDSCVSNGPQFVKDMSVIGRPAASTLLLDNSPVCYLFQPEQAMPIESFFEDKEDKMLITILPILDELAGCDDIAQVVTRHTGVDPTTPTLVTSKAHIAKHRKVWAGEYNGVISPKPKQRRPSLEDQAT